MAGSADIEACLAGGEGRGDGCVGTSKHWGVVSN